ATDPTPMLEFLQGKVSERKLRLFAVACCGRVRQLLRCPADQAGIDVAERYADGLATDEERVQIARASREYWNSCEHHSSVTELDTAAADAVWQIFQHDYLLNGLDFLLNGDLVSRCAVNAIEGDAA